MSEIRFAKSKVHFIGIGGIGMCGLAELLHNMGVQVQGSDQADNAQTKRLEQLGITVYRGHKPEQVEQADVVVYSSAVKKENVEYNRAMELRIPAIPRAEALAEIMRLKRGIAVAGTHGKTTTTSLTASVFINANFDPTVVVGGRLDLFKSTAKLGYGEWLIAEADESDGSFNKLSPEIVIITNIDNDHLDHYKTWENLKQAFIEFSSRIPFYGTAIYCGDDENLKELFLSFSKKSISYGFQKDNDYVLKPVGLKYEVYRDGEKLGVLNCPVPGDHNALNAMAAILAGLAAGISFDIGLKGIEKFGGVDRRFQFKGDVQGAKVYDDYGHHPTEISAVLSAFKKTFSDKYIKVVFQPHRYSRTEQCWSQFLDCFVDVDELLLLDIYPAGEAPIEGVSSQLLLKSIHHSVKAYIPSKEDCLELLASQLKGNQVILTLGAGDVWKIGEALLGEN